MIYRTIIFEDDAPVRHLLKLSAEMRGHDVITFECPTFCALSKKDKCTHEGACSDIIISDHQMPGMTGLEFFRVLKEKDCRIPNKALVTAACQENLKIEAQELGCRVIPKPFQIREINSWLEESELKISRDRELIPIEELY